MDYQQEWVNFLKARVEYLERNAPGFSDLKALTTGISTVLGGGGIFSVTQLHLPWWGWILAIIGIVVVATGIGVAMYRWKWGWIKKRRDERDKNKRERECLLDLIAVILENPNATEEEKYKGYEIAIQGKDLKEWRAWTKSRLKIKHSPKETTVDDLEKGFKELAL